MFFIKLNASFINFNNLFLLNSLCIFVGFQDSTDIIPEHREVEDCLGCVWEAIIQSVHGVDQIFYTRK